MILSSDPHAWLRPYIAILRADPAYRTLAIPLRFVALCDLVERDQPKRARQMREEWSPAMQEGTLKWLETVTDESAGGQRDGVVDGRERESDAAVRGPLSASRHRPSSDGRR